MIHVKAGALALIGAVSFVSGAVTGAIASLAQSQGVILTSDMLIPLFTSVVLIAVAWGVFKNKIENHQERIARLETESDGVIDEERMALYRQVIDERMVAMERRFVEWLQRIERDFLEWRRDQHQERRRGREPRSDTEVD